MFLVAQWKSGEEKKAEKAGKIGSDVTRCHSEGLASILGYTTSILDYMILTLNELILFSRES
jgi:hypothetical protein